VQPLTGTEQFADFTKFSDALPCHRWHSADRRRRIRSKPRN